MQEDDSKSGYGLGGGRTVSSYRTKGWSGFYRYPDPNSIVTPGIAPLPECIKGRLIPNTIIDENYLNKGNKAMSLEMLSHIVVDERCIKINIINLSIVLTHDAIDLASNIEFIQDLGNGEFYKQINVIDREWIVDVKISDISIIDRIDSTERFVIKEDVEVPDDYMAILMELLTVVVKADKEYILHPALDGSVMTWKLASTSDHTSELTSLDVLENHRIETYTIGSQGLKLYVDTPYPKCLKTRTVDLSAMTIHAPEEAFKDKLPRVVLSAKDILALEYEDELYSVEEGVVDLEGCLKNHELEVVVRSLGLIIGN